MYPNEDLTIEINRVASEYIELLKKNSIVFFITVIVCYHSLLFTIYHTWEQAKHILKTFLCNKGKERKVDFF